MEWWSMGVVERIFDLLTEHALPNTKHGSRIPLQLNEKRMAGHEWTRMDTNVRARLPKTDLMV
jgi:hypothetical protein